MNKIEKICPKCKGHNIELNSQANPSQTPIPGKDLKFVKYPEYLCTDCKKEFDQ